MQKLAASFLLLLALAGCVFPGVYKINVQQGNIVKQADLDNLKPGMSHKEVHYLLGTPLVKDTFDNSRDFYVYTFQEHGGKIKKQQIVVYYDHGSYTHYTANLLDKTPAY